MDGSLAQTARLLLAITQDNEGDLAELAPAGDRARCRQHLRAAT